MPPWLPLQWYQAALRLLPAQPATLSALGLTLQLQGSYPEAAEVGCGGRGAAGLL